jgi:glycosyltransferase involved in cell wall biosynthesis/CDP-glycerol glycerophosphotransferase (TagB/SpsB family)
MPRWIIRAYILLINIAQKCHRLFPPSSRVDRPYLPWLWRLLSKTREGSAAFTVITPVYNTGRYLDTYFKSLTRQTFDFKRHIHLIMVDDGSTDNSAAIIKKWQKRYPGNIEYIYQTNQGINRARNQGIEHVRTPWVTWIDSDDFLHPNYFYEIDKILRKYAKSRIILLAGREITYDGAADKFKDNRPFRFFFEENETLRPHNDLEDYIHLHINSAVFSTDEIQRQGLRFIQDSDWRSFEDAHFVLQYLGDTEAGKVLFCRGPRYYYRKRFEGSSLLDVAPTSRQAYIEVLEERYLDVLRHFKRKYGSVPKWIQNSILYAMSKKIKRVARHPQKSVAYLSPEERDAFLRLSKEIFSYIDADTISGFPYKLNTFGTFNQIGTRHVLKGEEIESPYSYIETFDPAKRLLKFLTYSSSAHDTMVVSFDGLSAEPVFTKTIDRKFLDRTFIYEHIQWIKFSGDLKVKAISCTRKGVEKELRLMIDLGAKKRLYWFGEEVAIYFKKLNSGIKKPSATAPWLIMDRDVVADDNAEHLYRHIAKNHPEQPILFAIRKSCPHWLRLKWEGFKLVDFGSRKYIKIVSQTSKLISSHMNQGTMQYKPDIMQKRRFICLQHGTIKDDLSDWLNGLTIDLFVTSTLPEYTSIVEDGSPYRMSRKEVVLTGLPRHDNLLRLAESSSSGTKNLLIMPTWRDFLTIKTPIKTYARDLVPDFFESTYARAWLGLLRSAHLMELAARHGYKITFFPHFGMQAYFKDMQIDPAVEVLAHAQTGIQRLFAEAAFMITDYSSVAFDMAFLQKPVLYYQFDEEDFFKGDHVYVKGYFDYRRDGFGPVCTDEAALLREIEMLMERDGQPLDIYRERMESSFPVRDGNACERVYQAIKALDIPA